MYSLPKCTVECTKSHIEIQKYPEIMNSTPAHLAANNMGVRAHFSKRAEPSVPEKYFDSAPKKTAY